MCKKTSHTLYIHLGFSYLQEKISLIHLEATYYIMICMNQSFLKYHLLGSALGSFIYLFIFIFAASNNEVMNVPVFG